MTTYPDIPEHIIKTWGSKRKFKIDKRKKIRKVLKELDELRRGCFFMGNSGNEIQKAIDMLEKAKDDHSVNKWGR